MNCYVCLIETGCDHHPAFALCQRCGAGICEKHLVEVIVVPPVGMGGDSRPRYSMICCRCRRVANLPTRSLWPEKSTGKRDEQEIFSGWRWLSQHWRRKQPELPKPEEAVAAVEQFLKRQRNR